MLDPTVWFGFAIMDDMEIHNLVCTVNIKWGRMDWDILSVKEFSSFNTKNPNDFFTFTIEDVMGY